MYLLHTIEVAFYSEQVIDPHQSKLTPRANTHSKLTPQSKISRTHIPSPEQLRPRANPQSKLTPQSNSSPEHLPRASPQSKISRTHIPSPEQLRPRASPQSKISRTHIPSPEQLRPRASPQSKGKVLTLGKKERKKNYCQIQFFLSISQVIICIFIICIFDLWIECVKNILIFCSKVYFHE